MITDIPPLFDAMWFRFVLGFIVGGILGSFGTMLAYRLPRKLSIMFPRSHCPSCNSVLGVRDLVPLVSWIVQKGRCRHCGARIGAKYLLIEGATSICCAMITLALGYTGWLIFGYLLILGVVVTVGCRDRDAAR